MTSCSRQFDFHGVIYHDKPCNVDNRRPNVRSNRTLYVKIGVSVQTRVTGNSNHPVQGGGIIIDSEGFVYARRIEINSFVAEYITACRCYIKQQITASANLFLK